MQIKGDGSIVMVDRGTTRAKCRHWRIVVHTDRGTKQKRFTGTYTQAKAELAHFKASLVIPQGEMLFSDYARKWLELRVRSGELRRQTLEKDRIQVNMLCRMLDGMRLCDLTPSVIREKLLDMKEARGLSNNYLNGFHVKLKSILESAVDDGELTANPMRRMKAPKLERPRRKALDEDTLWGFLRIMQATPLDAHTVGAQLAVLTGMRRGETCGLQWGDIVDGIAHIRRSVGDQGDVAEPKTTSGVRAVPIPNMMMRVLASWKSLQKDRLAVCGIAQTDDTPVLTSAVGTRLNPQNLDRWWRNNRDSFGLPGVVLHELRHTYATMLANQGAPSQVLKSVLGWASINMADTYVHDDTHANVEAVSEFSEKIDQMVS